MKVEMCLSCCGTKKEHVRDSAGLSAYHHVCRFCHGAGKVYVVDDEHEEAPSIMGCNWRRCESLMHGKRGWRTECNHVHYDDTVLVEWIWCPFCGRRRCIEAPVSGKEAYYQAME